MSVNHIFEIHTNELRRVALAAAARRGGDGSLVAGGAGAR